MTVIKPKSLHYLYKSLSAATFGSSKRARQILDATLRARHPRARHFSFEYFLHCPLSLEYSDRGRDTTTTAARREQRAKEMSTALSLAPFLPRLAKSLLAAPYISSGRLSYRLLSEEEVAQQRFVIPFEKTNLSRIVYDLNCDGAPRQHRDLLTNWIPAAQASSHRSRSVDRLQKQFDVRLLIRSFSNVAGTGSVVGGLIHHSHQDLQRLVEDYRPSPPRSMSPEMPRLIYESRLLQYGYLRALLSPLLLPSGTADSPDPVNVPAFSIFLPLMSERLFYGLQWVLILGVGSTLSSDGDDITPQRDVATDIATKLLPFFRTRSVPTLAILHQHFIEYVLDEQGKHHPRLQASNLENLLAGDGEPAQFETMSPGEPGDISLPYYLPFRHCQNTDSAVEASLARYWQRLKEDDERDNGPPELFKRYVVASQRMIALIENVCAKAANLTNEGSALPSALVVGGAGSGKDEIAKIFRTLSVSFRSGGIYIINMAALKPDYLAAPSLMGLEQHVKLPSAGEGEIQISGLLRRIRQKTNERVFERVVKRLLAMDPSEWSPWLNGGRPSGDSVLTYLSRTVGVWPTIMLDELNSLGIESQGVLLRFLEKGEITAIGGIEDNDQDALARFRDVHTADASEVQKAAAAAAWTWWSNLRESQRKNALVVGVMNENPDDLTREQAVEFLRSSKYLGGFVSDVLYEHFIHLRRLRPDVKYRMRRGGYFDLGELRERLDDIPILFMVWAQQEIERDDLFKHGGVWITDDAYAALCSPRHQWAGNIRELQDVVKKAVQHAQKANKVNAGNGGEFVIQAQDVAAGLAGPAYDGEDSVEV